MPKQKKKTLGMEARGLGQGVRRRRIEIQGFSLVIYFIRHFVMSTCIDTLGFQATFAAAHALTTPRMPTTPSANPSACRRISGSMAPGLVTATIQLSCAGLFAKSPSSQCSTPPITRLGVMNNTRKSGDLRGRTPSGWHLWLCNSFDSAVSGGAERGLTTVMCCALIVKCLSARPQTEEYCTSLQRNAHITHAFWHCDLASESCMDFFDAARHNIASHIRFKYLQ